MKNGGRIPWNATGYLRNIQDLLSDGKAPYERRFGEPFSSTNNSSREQWLNIIRPQARDQSIIHQFGKKVFPGIFLGCELIAEGIR